jgi:hypothetical protein
MTHPAFASMLEKLSAAHVAAHREYLQIHEDLLKRVHQVAEGRRRARPIFNELDAHRAAGLKLKDADGALQKFLRQNAEYV